MWCHAQYSSGKRAEGDDVCYSGASWASGGENIACCVCFLSALLIADFFSLCQSVKLFSSQPTNFCLFSFWFSSLSHQEGGRSERVTVWFFVTNWGKKQQLVKTCIFAEMGIKPVPQKITAVLCFRRESRIFQLLAVGYWAQSVKSLQQGSRRVWPAGRGRFSFPSTLP